MVGLIQHVFSNTVANATGTITIWNISGNSTTIAATNVVRPQDWNSTHNIFVTISGNTNTAGNSTVSGTNIYLQGGPGIYLSGTSNSIIVNAVTQSASQPNGMAGGSYSTLGQNTVYVQPFYLNNVNLSMTAMIMPLSFNNVTSTTNQRLGWTMSYGLYSLNVSTLSLITSSSLAIQISCSSNVSYGYTVSGTGAAASFTTSSAGTGLTANFAEQVFMYFPFATSLAPGSTYYGAFVNSTSSASSSQLLSVSAMLIPGFATSAWGTAGTNSIPTITSTTVTDRFQGGFYSLTTGGLPATLNNSAFQNNASNANFYFEMAAS